MVAKEGREAREEGRKVRRQLQRGKDGGQCRRREGEKEDEYVHMCWLHFTFTPFSLSRPSMNCMILLTFEACLLSLNLIFLEML